jgi:hypothetical protein
MSANDKPEMRAYRELEMLVRHLGEELVSFRKRALSAEGQLKEASQAPPAKGKSASPERLAELESENDTLRKRLEMTEDRVRQMLDRMRFLRQQLQAHAPGGTAVRRS